MGEAPHHYLIFETTGGFCGIAWNNVGITRFQLPTKSAVAAERTLLRRVPGAERSAPIPEVVEAVAAVKRYFEGEETDFSANLRGGAAGRMGPHNDLWQSGEGTRRRARGCARPELIEQPPARSVMGHSRSILSANVSGLWGRERPFMRER